MKTKSFHPIIQLRAKDGKSEGAKPYGERGRRIELLSDSECSKSRWSIDTNWPAVVSGQRQWSAEARAVVAGGTNSHSHHSGRIFQSVPFGNIASVLENIVERGSAVLKVTLKV